MGACAKSKGSDKITLRLTSTSRQTPFTDRTAVANMDCYEGVSRGLLGLDSSNKPGSLSPAQTASYAVASVLFVIGSGLAAGGPR
jgi:hypothetical protein